MGKDLFTELVDKLIKAQIDFSFHFIIKELLAEHSEGIYCTVIVEVQGVEHISVHI
jgi:hypothetical protein